MRLFRLLASALRQLPIRWKLIVFTAGTTLLVLMIAGVILYVYERNSYLESVKGDTETLAAIAAANSVAPITFHDQKAAEDTLRSLREKSDVIAVALYTPDQKLFAKYSRENSWEFPVAPERDGLFVQEAHLSLYKPVLLEQERIGTIYLVASLAGFAERLSLFVKVMIGVAVLATLIAFAIAAQLQTVISRPILALAATATQVRENKDFGIRAERTASDEVGFLIDRFNEMLSEIQNRDAALHSAQASLEKRVEERTTEINELNRSLQDRAAQLEVANKELESFSYSVSHDLRAPLRHISGYIEMLEVDAEGQLNELSQSHVKTIKESVKEAGALIDDLLSFSRMSRSEMQRSPVDLNAMVEEIRRKQALEIGSREVAWTVEGLPVVQADRAMMRIVMLNLISNAVKYTRTRPKAEIRISATSNDAETVVAVSDNGIGFDPRYTDRLFGVFHRLHGGDFEGTGIGLATVRRIVARHGGRTWAEGILNKGATFYFSLPRQGSIVRE